MIALLLACEELPSTDVMNDELALTALVTTDGSSTQIDAKVQRGQGLGWTPVHVAGEEALVATWDGDDHTLEAVELGLGDVGYTTTVSAASDGADLGVRFDRTADDTIEGTSVAVPPEFEITAPLPGAGVAADTALIVLWDGSWEEGTITLSFSGECIPGWEVTDADDVGELDIPAEALASEGAACGATLTLVRTAAGTLSEAWGAGGSISAQNGRAVTVAVGN
ncbi:hypothetical protein LBMAG42_11400 [Deltaproteobacteria bacterium]|nr:hypothetical protein LBMAG42_11400 [Deltaproteobacteria bacterium]